MLEHAARLKRDAMFVAARRGEKRALRGLAADHAHAIQDACAREERPRLRAATKATREEVRYAPRVHRSATVKRERMNCRPARRRRHLDRRSRLQAGRCSPSKESPGARPAAHGRAPEDAGRAAARAKGAQRSACASASEQAFDPHSPTCPALRLQFACAVFTYFPAP